MSALGNVASFWGLAHTFTLPNFPIGINENRSLSGGILLLFYCERVAPSSGVEQLEPGVRQTHRVRPLMVIQEDEMDRLEREYMRLSMSAPPEGHPLHEEFRAAKQALAWAIDPEFARSPTDVLVGVSSSD